VSFSRSDDLPIMEIDRKSERTPGYEYVAENAMFVITSKGVYYKFKYGGDDLGKKKMSYRGESIMVDEVASWEGIL